MSADIFDKRSDFFRRYFEKGKPYDEYIATGRAEQQQRWKTIEEKTLLASEDLKLIASFTRKINVLVLSGIWCGDCARQGPMLKKIADASKTIQLKFIDNNENPELRDELRIAGGSRVPVVLALSEDFFEIARLGDRHLSVYRKKAETELGAACDPGILPPHGKDLEFEIAEWVRFFERVHLVLRLSPFLRARYRD